MASEASLRALIESYQDLNSSSIDELAVEPSPLEFMRYVSQNRPFVVRGAARQWPAMGKWNTEYLKQQLQGKEVQVAITPDGRADAPMRATDGRLYFAKPLERTLPFEQVLARVVNHAQEDSEEVWYAQTQNDNLRSEYLEVFSDVAQDIPWARIALDKKPDAVNMWIGSAKSVTALHRDPYQNIYVQVVGAKRFVLIPPAEMPAVNEHMLPAASWTAQNCSGGDAAHRAVGLRLVPDEDTDPVPCALWDPDVPEVDGNGFSNMCRPLHAELQPGDMLYLPALWYHKVSQSVGPEGFCCAVNYWYDMDYGGSFHVFDQFIRQATLQGI